MNAKDLSIKEYPSYIVFITGGTKSGKSEFAEYLAKEVKNLSYVDETDNSETLPFKIAAIRESFEEANVLFANDKSSKSHISIKRLKNFFFIA